MGSCMVDNSSDSDSDVAVDIVACIGGASYFACGADIARQGSFSGSFSASSIKISTNTPFFFFSSSNV
jgi:hypothetical protein